MLVIFSALSRIFCRRQEALPEFFLCRTFSGYKSFGRELFFVSRRCASRSASSLFDPEQSDKAKRLASFLGTR